MEETATIKLSTYDAFRKVERESAAEIEKAKQDKIKAVQAIGLFAKYLASAGIPDIDIHEAMTKAGFRIELITETGHTAHIGNGIEVIKVDLFKR